MSQDEVRISDLSLLVCQAHALIERRRFAQARSVVSGGLRDYPESTELQYLAAYVDYSQGRHQDAIETARQVLARDPQHYGTRILLAELHEARREYAEAERLWLDLLQEYPASPDCYAAYADLLLRTLHLEKAEQLVLEGLRLDPSHENCLYEAALIEMIRGNSRNNEYLQRLVREHPERLNTLIALIVALEERGDTRSALRVAQQLLRTRPNSEPCVNLVRQLRLRRHWSLLPLYPMQRWGWGGAAAVTVAGLTLVRVAEHSLSARLATGIVLVWLAYVIYSWVWPPLLKKRI